jgi:hypothetical protein
MSSMLPFDTLVDVVRFKLYQLLTVDGSLWPDVSILAQSLNGRVTKSYLAVVLGQLASSKHVELGDSRQGVTARLLPSGIRVVERQLAQPESNASRFRELGYDAFEDNAIKLTVVPASDRVVRLDHNSEGLQEIRASAGDLKRQLQQSNDIGDMSDDDRKVAIQEIEGIEQDLSGEHLRLGAFLLRARSTLVWIGQQAGGAVVGTLALALLALIANFFGVSF